MEHRRKEIGTAAINFAVEYFDKYEVEIQKGHSKEWSDLYAESIEGHPHAFNDAYIAIKEKNPEKAIEELKIHCMAIGGDELYTKHFIFLMESGGALSDPDKQAARYSAIYKEQIALDKSEVFAHEYADLMAEDEFSESYCFIYSKYIEESILNGKSEIYAKSLASKMADYYGDQYSLSRDIAYDELDLYHEDKIRESCKGIK
ncbi:MAG: hypothetical protein IPN14_08610 [Bacteroidetes bacterium]|nr:hypothetical protein [Bacteroidota bacterium]